MSTFTITPDLRLLKRYLTEFTDEEFDIENPSYVPKEIQIKVEWSVFDDIQAFEVSFSALLNNYQLATHYDNLLYLVLYTYNFVWQEIQVAYDNYESLKRARELAKLILLLKDTKPGKLSQVSFKSFNAVEKMQDSAVNDWISNTLLKALESKDFPINRFGIVVLEMLTNLKEPFDYEPVNVEKVRAYANKRLINPKNRIRKGMVTIARVALKYLNNETDFRPNDNVAFTDDQLNFLFNLLQLLKLVNELQIDSDNKDYTRTLIMNYVSI